MHMLRLSGVLLLFLPFLTLAAEQPAAPTTLVKVDDFEVTNLHFAVFSAQSQGTDAPQEQIALLNELVNIFMVANSPAGMELARNPEVVAAMEVTRARLLAQTLIRDHLANSEVSEEELQRLYQEEYGNKLNLELQARHILLKTEEEAEQVIKDLDAGGDFATLASEKSTGPSAKVGGDLGWFTPDQMVGPFSKATLQLQDGEYSKIPVQTQFGWHVILRIASREVPIPELDSVRDELEKQARSNSLAKLVRGLRESTRIQVVGADAEVNE